MNARDKIKKILNRRVLILDGASGTELHKRGMPAGTSPEIWCMENPGVISGIHLDYKNVGADIVYTSTFGANREKLSQYDFSNVSLLNRKLAITARNAVGKETMVAGDIGPTGRFIKPFGDLDFDKAVGIFKEQAKALISGGVDLFIIETMMDIQEARAALIAVREITDKFTMVTMTYEKHCRTLSGNDPVSALITLQSLGADAVGCNCSTGPADMLKIVKLMKPFAKVPILAKPNAGIPKLVGTKTFFDMTPEKFGSFGGKFLSSGAGILGGCCGTTPKHIECLKKTVRGKKTKVGRGDSIYALSSPRSYFVFGKKMRAGIVGERINPTGKKKMQAELLHGKIGLIRDTAKEQESNGADLLDINVGAPGVNEEKAMALALSTIIRTTNLPLVIDSSNPKVIERALRLYPGRALINSVSGEKKKIKNLLPLVKKYGAMFVLLPLTDKGIPHTFLKRKFVIKKIIGIALKLGIKKEDIISDGLVMAFSSDEQAPIETLKTIEWCRESLNCKTIIGLSNVSFGMPRRDLINAAFLKLAEQKGVTLAITDPVIRKIKSDRLAENLLLGRDKGGSKFIKHYARSPLLKKEKKRKEGLSHSGKIFKAIVDGDKEGIVDFVKISLKENKNASELLKKYMIPAVIRVGELFDRKIYFLPQLIASAETMKKGFKFLEPYLKEKKSESRKRALILIATVEGDIHDIGKNIVSLMLKNHGFSVIDLGKDISSKRIMHEIKRHSPDIVGLSALMTTTMVNMGKIIESVEEEGLSCKFMVGGAVVDKGYADSIGANYAGDGVGAVKLAEVLIKDKRK